MPLLFSKYLPAGILAGFFFLTACGTMTEGQTQTISIVTPDVEEAACRLIAPDGEIFKVPSTPGTITIPRFTGKLHVICTRPGYKTGQIVVSDEMSTGMKKSLFIVGFGGLIDFANRADRAYPAQIDVWMEPSFWRSDAERQEWMNKKRAYEQKKQDGVHQCRFSEWKNC
jgi:hypothetical protein